MEGTTHDVGMWRYGRAEWASTETEKAPAQAGLTAPPPVFAVMDTASFAKRADSTGRRDESLSITVSMRGATIEVPAGSAGAGIFSALSAVALL